MVVEGESKTDEDWRRKERRSRQTSALETRPHGIRKLLGKWKRTGQTADVGLEIEWQLERVRERERGRDAGRNFPSFLAFSWKSVEHLRIVMPSFFFFLIWFYYFFFFTFMKIYVIGLNASLNFHHARLSIQINEMNDARSNERTGIECCYVGLPAPQRPAQTENKLHWLIIYSVQYSKWQHRISISINTCVCIYYYPCWKLQYSKRKIAIDK